jgi:hypothetical protein
MRCTRNPIDPRIRAGITSPGLRAMVVIAKLLIKTAPVEKLP